MPISDLNNIIVIITTHATKNDNDNNNNNALLSLVVTIPRVNSIMHSLERRARTTTEHPPRCEIYIST